MLEAFQKKLKHIYSYSARRALFNHILKYEKNLLEFCVSGTLLFVKVQVSQKMTKMHFFSEDARSKTSISQERYNIFQTASVKIHQTFAPTTYIKTSQIGDHRFGSCCGSRSWLIRGIAHMHNDNNKSKYIRERKRKIYTTNDKKIAPRIFYLKYRIYNQKKFSWI